MRAAMLVLTTALASTALVATADPAKAEGFHVDVHGGWDSLSTGGENESGAVYGIGAGYDFKLGENMFAGLAVSADLSTTDECVNNVLIAGDRACVDAGRDLSAVARLGYAVTPKDRLYTFAGYSNVRFKAVYIAPGGAITRDAANLNGLRVGAEYEHMLRDNAFAKVEYRYSNYEGGTSRHQALVGVGYVF